MESDRQQRRRMAGHAAGAALLTLALASPISPAFAQTALPGDRAYAAKMGAIEESDGSPRTGHGVHMALPDGQLLPASRGARTPEAPSSFAMPGIPSDQPGQAFDMSEERATQETAAPAEKNRARKARRLWRGSEFPGVIRFP